MKFAVSPYAVAAFVPLAFATALNAVLLIGISVSGKLGGARSQVDHSARGE